MAHSKNTRLALNLLAVVVGMGLLAYASVPLYRLFCQMTGYDGTTQKSVALPSHVVDRSVTVTFNGDTDPQLPWEFKPGELRHVVKVGEQALSFFTAKNLTGHSITGRAVYNVVPFKAGAYFVKIACFCFTEQTLAPHEEKRMPVSFYIDPSIMDDPEMKDVKTITLSYTFFSVKK